MPAVFVHGVPESAAVWRPMLDVLERDDVITASPPGLGSELPRDVGATKEQYVEWLIDVLTDIAEPVDLVGHDVGGLLTVRVASVRSDLLRSWVSDGLSVLHPDYVWHRYAQRWQDPEVGPADIEAMLGVSIADRAAPYERWGLSRDQAQELAGWFDEAMGRAILGFYPSVATINEDWGPDVPRIEAPGLALPASEDPFVRPELAEPFADHPAIRVHGFDGVGHWWMMEAPARAARILQDFWASL